LEIRKKFFYFVLPILISGFNSITVLAQLPESNSLPSEEITEIMVQRVDAKGNITPLLANEKLKWLYPKANPSVSDAGEPCAEIEFNDSFLSDWSSIKVTEQKGAWVRVSGTKITTCLRGPSATFTLREGRQKNGRQMNYVLDSPEGIAARRSGASEKGVSTDVVPTTAKTPDHVKSKLPVSEADATKVSVSRYLNLFGGFSAVAHQTNYGVANTDSSFTGNQFHFLADGVYPSAWTDVVFEGELRADLFASLPQIFMGDLLIEKKISQWMGNTIFIGLGLNEIAMAGDHSYGINQSVNLALRAKIQSPDARWAGAVTFAPTLSSPFSLASYWLNLNGFYQVPIFQKNILMGTDLNFFAVPAAVSKNYENYNARSLAFLLGYQFGEKQ
jgi:hypothetical protein